MSTRVGAALGALAAFWLATAASARTEDGPAWSLSGFGTVGAVTTNEHDADFVASHTQPHGAGATQRIDLGPDSKLGLQIDGGIGQWSAVLQIVSQLQSNATFTPEIEWANVKYQVTPDWSIRAGRVALPTLMESDYRLIGFANTTIRPPIEAYAVIPATSITGLDTTWRHQFGRVTNSLQLLYGSFSQGYPEHGAIRVPNAFGGSDLVDVGPVTIHLSYASAALEFTDPFTDGLNSALVQYGQLLESLPVPALQAQGAQALTLSRDYAVHGQRTRLASLGATYDKGNWLATAEWLRMSNAGLIATNAAEYVTLGYRVGRFMPYGTLAAVKSTDVLPRPLSPVGLPPALAQETLQLDGGFAALIRAQQATQTTRSLGVRYELRSNLDLKLQIDKTDIGAGGAGFLTNVQPGFVLGSNLYVYSLAMDFVF